MEQERVYVVTLNAGQPDEDAWSDWDTMDGATEAEQSSELSKEMISRKAGLAPGQRVLVVMYVPVDMGGSYPAITNPQVVVTIKEGE